MLIPSKHAHPDETALAAAMTMLKLLKKERIVPYSRLLHTISDRRGTGIYLFSPGISLLYLLGLVEYRAGADSFEYTGA